MADDADIDQLRDELVAAGQLAAFHPSGYWMTPIRGAAVLLKRERKTLYNWRDNGQPPHAIRFDGELYYRLDDIAEYRQSGTLLPCAGAVRRQ